MVKENNETNETVQEIKQEEKPKIYRFAFSSEELEKMELKGETAKEKEDALREMLQLEPRVKNTQKTKLLKGLGLERGASQKDIIIAMNKKLDEVKNDGVKNE